MLKLIDEFALLWELLITGLGIALTWFAIHYDGEAKRWLRWNVALFVSVAFPAVLLYISQLLGASSAPVGPLLWLLALIPASLVVTGCYPLTGLSLFLGAVVLGKSRVPGLAKIVGVVTSLASCFLIFLYAYIARHQPHW